VLGVGIAEAAGAGAAGAALGVAAGGLVLSAIALSKAEGPNTCGYAALAAAIRLGSPVETASLYKSYAAFSASAAASQYKKFTVPVSSLSGYDPDAIRGFIVVSGSLLNAGNNLPAFTITDGTNITFVVTGSVAPGQGTAVTVFYNKTTTDRFRGDFVETAGQGIFNPDLLDGVGTLPD